MLTRNFIDRCALTTLPLALGLIEGGTIARAQSLKVESFRFASVGVHYPVDLDSPKPPKFSVQGGGGAESVSTTVKPFSTQFGLEGGFAQTKTPFLYKGNLTLSDFVNLPPFTLNKIPVSICFYSGLDGSIVDELEGLVGADGDFTVLSDANPAPLIDGVSYPTQISVKAPHWLRRRLSPTQPVTLAGYPSVRFTLINGDANNDNVVDTADNVFVARHMQSKLGEPKYDPNADLNGDSKVTPADLKIVHSERVTKGDE
jgi:hypothetical protein